MASETLKKLEELTHKLPVIGNNIVHRTFEEHVLERVEYEGKSGNYSGLFCFEDDGKDDIHVKQLDIPKGSSTKHHGHKGEENCFVYSGSIIVKIRGESKRYSKGDWFYVPADTPHFGTASEHTKCIVIITGAEE